jgi:hypothetical protein
MPVPMDIWLRSEITKQQKRSRFLRNHLANLIEKGGTSSHSGNGMTLRYMMEGLEDARCPYTMTAVPGVGYFIEVKKPEERFNAESNS